MVPLPESWRFWHTETCIKANLSSYALTATKLDLARKDEDKVKKFHHNENLLTLGVPYVTKHQGKIKQNFYNKYIYLQKKLGGQSNAYLNIIFTAKASSTKQCMH
jgi:phosphotransferase system IIB component